MIKFLAYSYFCIIWTVGAVYSNDHLDEKFKSIINQRCMECHDDTAKGELDLTDYLDQYDRKKHKDIWVMVEENIRTGKMPPKKKDALSKKEQLLVQNWFEKEYVKFNGIQHAGPSFARRLTRAELQNTLEDLLHIELRKRISTDISVNPFKKSIIQEFLPADLVGKSGFSNDYIALNSATLNIKKYIQSYEYVLSYLNSHKEARKKLFGSDELPLQLNDEEVKTILKKFINRAFRRNGNEKEFQVYLNLYDRLSKSNKSVYESLKSTFKSILLSPSFLYRQEKQDKSVYKLNDHELATMLSYFLWSSMPDEELLNLAEKNILSEPKVLNTQIKRMLSSPKRIALSENMAAEWFGFYKLADSDIEKHMKIKFHRRLDPTRSMYETSVLFFDSLIRYNRPLNEIVDSDWEPVQGGTLKELAGTDLGPISMYYRKLSRIVKQGQFEFAYKPIDSFRKIKDRDYGGFLTMKSTLALTSSKNETSPIIRGVWVLENILGRHMKAPKNVPPLQKDKNKSLVDLIRDHAKKKQCASCHQYIDPLGFGLERFDQNGNKRNVKEIIKAKLPNGKAFNSPAELKKALLVNYSDEIQENIIKRFLSYALGRSIEPVDRPAIQKIKNELQKEQGGIRDLIEKVVMSYPFQYREASL